MTATETTAWTQVCELDSLTPGRGAAALIAGRQVAVFRVSTPDGDQVFAIDNRCPFSGAQVMSRGIVGDRAGAPKVASPVYKQSFDLRTGECFDDPAVRVPTYPVSVDEDGWVLLGVPTG